MAAMRPQMARALVWCSLSLTTYSMRVQQPVDDMNDNAYNITEWQLEVETNKHALIRSQDQGGALNLCINGHLAPEFFLLGAQKAGTTSFSAALAHPQLIYPHAVQGDATWNGTKELLPFDKTYRFGRGIGGKELHVFDKVERFGRGIDFWLSHYPECTTRTRAVAVDSTPDYLFTDAAPRRMEQFYGASIHRIKLAIILRDPVARIHSAFHMYEQIAGRGESWAACVTGSDFKSYANQILRGIDPCSFFARTDYAKELSTFLAVFHPSQITVFPFLRIVDPKQNSSMAVAAVWQSLGISGVPPALSHANHHPHASVMDDLGATLLAEFQHFANAKIGATHIANVIVDNNIELYGYEDTKDATHVAAWLEQSW